MTFKKEINFKLTTTCCKSKSLNLIDIKIDQPDFFSSACIMKNIPVKKFGL